MIVSECEGRQMLTRVGAAVGAAGGGAATAPLGAALLGAAPPPLPAPAAGPLGAAGWPHASSSALDAIVATRRHITPSHPRLGQACARRVLRPRNRGAPARRRAIQT